MDTGLIIIIVSLGIPLIVIGGILYFVKRSFGRNKKFADDLKIKIANAKPALAKVISASQGLAGGDIKKLIFLVLEINDGFSQPYQAEAAWFVDTLHFDNIKEGNAISVKINSEDKNIIYPAESWAVYTEGYSKDLSIENLQKKLK
jgi:hypothetical protein